jgi:DNA-directed RNA polymerase specialized sigma24 family protein
VTDDRALLVRAEAARRLIEDDPTVDPLEVLAAVLWPSERLLAAVSPRARPVTEAEAERIRRLVHEGLSQRAIGEQVGRPRTTVSWVLSRGRPEAT